VPVVGVIEPGVRSLVKATETGRVAVIGTVGTIGSGAYQRAVAATGAGVELTCAACPGFVEFVEQGDVRSEQVHVLAERLLAPVRAAEVDALLLGCTHYPFLARTITDVVGRDVVLVSSADETAFEVRSLLAGSDLARDPVGGPASARFLSSGDPCWFATLGRRLLGMELGEVAPVRWPA
jgi:glutamate racemase